MLDRPGCLGLLQDTRVRRPLQDPEPVLARLGGLAKVLGVRRGG